MQETHFMTTTQAAHYLGGLSPRTLEKLRVIGGGPVFHKHGRRVFYNQTDLDEWSNAGRRQSTSDPGCLVSDMQGIDGAKPN